jgi:putative ABC transport system permease protein
MLAVFRTLSTRHLWKRRARAGLVVASIALGVAAWVATGVLNQSLDRSIQVATSPLGGVADFYVTNGEMGVQRALANRLARVPGVKKVQPLVLGSVQVLLPGQKLRSAILVGMRQDSEHVNDAAAWGLDIHPRLSLGLLRSVMGGPPPAFLGRRLDEALPSDATEMTILAAGERRQVVRAGTVDASGPAATLGGSVIFLDEEAASKLLDRPGRVSRLDVVVDPSSDRAEVRKRVEEEIEREQRSLRPEQLLALEVTAQEGFPAGLPWAALMPGGMPARVRTPEAQGERVRDVLVGIQVGFMLCGAGALVVGLFLVYNALAVSVAERAHEIGILRSLGATRGQVRQLFLGEALLLGAVGAVLGVPLGLGLGRLLLGPMQRVVSDLFLPLSSRALSVDPVNVVEGVCAGVITALLAALVPASRAAAREPADAVRRVPPSASGFYRLLQVGGSLLLVLIGLAGLFFKENLPPRLGSYSGLVLVLLATLVATPAMAAVLARLLRPVARRLLGIEGRLAADNLIRAPGRTGLVIAALAASVGLIVQTAGVIRSNEDAILGWLDQTLTPDLILTAGGPLSASGQNLPMKVSLRERLEEEFPGSRVVPVSFFYAAWQWQGHETIVLVNALDARTYYLANKERGKPVPDLELFRELAEQPGTAVASNNFLQLHRVHVGETLHLPGVFGPVPVRIIGSIDDYSWNRGTILIHRDHFTGQLDLKLADAFDLYLPPGVDAEMARRQLQQSPWGAEQALYALTSGELHSAIRGMVDQLYGLAYAQQALVGVVAVLGVVTALMISVLQRRRELGLLRAVGASQAQVLRSVLAEAVLMGAIGTAIGLLIGIPMQWYVVQIILLEEAGLAFPVRLPWLAAAGIACLAMLCATLAGLWPALQAVRVRIAEAIAYE